MLRPSDFITVNTVRVRSDFNKLKSLNLIIS